MPTITALPDVSAPSISDSSSLPIVAGGITSEVTVAELRKALAVNHIPGIVDPVTGWYFAKDFGSTGDGLTDDRGALHTLTNVTMPQLPNLGGVLYFSPGLYRIASDMTFADRSTLKFAQGAALYLDATVTVTINGFVDAGLYTIFTGPGAVTAAGSSAPMTTGIRFGMGRTTSVYPQWWGGEGDSLGHDDTPMIQAAIDASESTSAPNSEPTVKICLESKSEWLVTQEILISKAYTLIDGGSGAIITSVRFETLTGTAGTCFRFEGPHAGTPLYGCGIRGIFFVSGNSSYKKIAVDCIDVSGFIFERILTNGWNGAKSTLFRFSGRDHCRLRDIACYADRPIEFLENTYSPTLALDHCHITDTELVTQDGAEYAITIRDNVGLANLTIDGRNAWGGGRGGLYYVPTTSPTPQLQVNIYNLRYETPTTNGFFTIEWGSSAVVTRQFNLHGCNLGGSGASTNNGLKLRGCYGVTVVGCIYTGSAVPLDLDSTVHDYNQNNFIMIGGTPSITGMTKVMEAPNAGGYAMSPTAWYTNSADVTNPIFRLLNLVLTPQTTPANLQDGMMWSTTNGLFGQVASNPGLIALDRVSADRGDTSPTLVWGTDAPTQRFATVLAGNRTITLGTPAPNGARFRVVRTGLGAFTLDVGGLKTIPSATAAYVDVEYSGPAAAWVLTGYGLL